MADSNGPPKKKYKPPSKESNAKLERKPILFGSGQTNCEEKPEKDKEDNRNAEKEEPNMEEEEDETECKEEEEDETECEEEEEDEAQCEEEEEDEAECEEEEETEVDEQAEAPATDKYECRNM